MIVKLLLSMILTFNFVYADFPNPQQQINIIIDEEEQQNDIEKPDLSCEEGDDPSQCVGDRNDDKTFSTLKREKHGELDYSVRKSENGPVLSKPIDEIKFDNGYTYYLGGEEVTAEEYAEFEGVRETVYKINDEVVTSIDYMEQREEADSSSVEYYDNPKMKIMYYINGENVTEVEYNNNVTEPSQKIYYIDGEAKSSYEYNTYKEKEARTNYNNMFNFFSNEATVTPNAMDSVRKSFIDVEDNPLKNELENDFGEVSTRDNLYQKHFDYEMDPMTSDAIAGDNPNDPRVLDHQKIANYRDQLKSKWTNMYKDTIKCSISRKLIPSYVCPYLDRNGTFYGGTIQDSVNEKKEECEEQCVETYGCMAKEIDGATVSTVDGELPKDVHNFTADDLTAENNYRILVEANNVQSTKYVHIKVVGTWKEVYTNELRNPNGEYLYGLKDDRIYYSLFTKYNNSDWINHTERGSFPFVKPEEGASDSERAFEGILKLPINNVLDAVEFQLLPHQDLDLEDVYVDSITFEYEDSDMWFCPDRQRFDPTLLNCNDGVVKNVELKNGLDMKICVSNTSKMGPESNYGAYYSKESCENGCFRKKRCTPSYKHFRTSEMNKQNFFQIDVNCYDLENNTECTKELCTEYINQNIDVINEWNLNSKDKMESIVSFGVLQDGKTRPKVDLTRETISESSTDEEIRILEIATQKDAAYLDMINQQSFNFVTEPIGEPSPKQYAYEQQTSEAGSRYAWIVKPESEEFDRPMYMYSVVEFDQMFYPKYGTYVMPDTLTGGTRIISNDPLMQIKDRTYMIKEASGDFSVFRKIENSHFYVLETVLDESVEPPVEREIRTWKEASAAYYNDELVRYVNGELEDLPGSLQAPHFELVSPGFDRSVNQYRYVISDAMVDDITNVGGGLLREQITEDHGQSLTRTYDGEFDTSNYEMYRGTLEGLKIYGIYSDTPLTYDEIVEQLTEENTVYDIKGSFLYNQEIIGDQEYLNNIKLFKQGTSDKTTIHLDLKPYEKEIGKRGFIFMFLY